MISSDGLSLIKYFENCKLTAYQDGAGIWTCGWGNTIGVTPATVYTQDQADSILIDSINQAEQRLNGVLTVPVIQCERDALISQAYNLRSFRLLVDHLNIEGRAVYLDKLPLYCRDAEGNIEPGLVTRRRAEGLLFKGNTWSFIYNELTTPRAA